MTETSSRGRFVWHELNTLDVPAAVGFYTSVVGWNTQPFADDPSYLMWTAQEAPVGGVMTLAEEAKEMGAAPHWLSYVAVPDVDATVIQATGLGATTYVPPMDIPNIGRFSVLADPQGAIFAVFRGMDEWPGEDAPPRVGEFSWHELATTDWNAALNFYRALFGWDAMDAMDMGPMGTYQIYGRNGVQLGGMFNKSPEMPAPTHWLPYAFVKDADKAAATATANGGTIIAGPMDVPGGGRIAIGIDPQGAPFAVHSMTAAAAPSTGSSSSSAARRPGAKKAAARQAVAKKAAKKAVKKAVKRTAKKAAKKAGKKAVKKAVKRPAKKAAKKVGARKAPARKTARTKKRLTKSAARKPSRARARPASRRVAKRASAASRTRRATRKK